jgi:hypothetical protein
MYDAQVALASSAESRSSRRRVVNLAGHARSEGFPVHLVKVTDLSEDGCKVSGLEMIDPGCQIWLKVDGITPRLARVVWSEGGLAGCEFLSPLGTQVVELAEEGRAKELRRRVDFRRSRFGS